MEENLARPGSSCTPCARRKGTSLMESTHAAVRDRNPLQISVSILAEVYTELGVWAEGSRPTTLTKLSLAGHTNCTNDAPYRCTARSWGATGGDINQAASTPGQHGAPFTGRPRRPEYGDLRSGACEPSPTHGQPPRGDDNPGQGSARVRTGPPPTEARRNEISLG